MNACLGYLYKKVLEKGKKKENPYFFEDFLFFGTLLAHTSG